jgi:hypothetical protein
VAQIRDPEGLAATCEEFDEHISADRESRLAFAVMGGSGAALAAALEAPG